jgi:hypothetical protein
VAEVLEVPGPSAWPATTLPGRLLSDPVAGETRAVARSQGVPWGDSTPKKAKTGPNAARPKAPFFGSTTGKPPLQANFRKPASTLNTREVAGSQGGPRRVERQLLLLS